METLIKNILGNMSSINFITYMLFALLGMFINVISDITRRKPKSVASPTKFSISYWLKDNFTKMSTSILMMPLMIILFQQVTGSEISNLLALGIGFSSDHLCEILKRKNILNSI